jgi:hypothetical protein
MDYDRRQVGALERVMDAHYEKIKEKVDVRAIMESSDSDNENEQVFRVLRPNTAYTLKDIVTKKVQDPESRSALKSRKKPWAQSKEGLSEKSTKMSITAAGKGPKTSVQRRNHQGAKLATAQAGLSAPASRQQVRQNLVRPSRTSKNQSLVAIKGLEEFEISGDARAKAAKKKQYLARVEERRQEILNGQRDIFILNQDDTEAITRKLEQHSVRNSAPHGVPQEADKLGRDSPSRFDMSNYQPMESEMIEVPEDLDGGRDARGAARLTPVVETYIMRGQEVTHEKISKAVDDRISHLSRRSAYKSQRFAGSLAALRSSNQNNLVASMI